MHSNGNDADPVIDDLLDIRFSVKLSTGYDIRIGNVIVSPVFTYDHPLNTIRSNSTDNNWEISSLFVSVMIQYNL